MEIITPEPTSSPFPFSVSSGDAAISDSANSELSVDTPNSSSDTSVDTIIYAASSDEDVLLLLQDVQESQALILASNQRQELQFEACISILLIFLIVGLLNYIYKFFKMFF